MEINSITEVSQEKAIALFPPFISIQLMPLLGESPRRTLNLKFPNEPTSNSGTGLLKGDGVKASAVEDFHDANWTGTKPHFHCWSCLFFQSPMRSDPIMD